MSTYWIRGSIPLDTLVTLTYTDENGIIYFLRKLLVNGQSILVFDPTGDSYEVFNMESARDIGTMSLRSQNTTGWLGVNLQNGEVEIISIRETIYPLTTEVNPWGIALAGVTYQLEANGFPMRFRYLIPDIANWTDRSQPPPILTPPNTGQISPTRIQKIRILPLNVYATGACSVPITGDEVVRREIEWNYDGNVEKSFTTEDDCNVGIFYKYCGPGVVCSSNCRSSCNTGINADSCQWDENMSQFMCINAGNGEGGNIGVGIILLVVIVIIIIVILLIVGIIIYSRR
ncbi:Transmembrane domain-containing protein [Orpheovirus IHUMI-LCC2]|uniref:Transmembrane domain-containing protein n=1 Tax=Orpheovirus IHUMI-LCC2 TaxID=2023057 RepID=A0A2I2L5N4_9VIRU|nr:Transmembrane domain-containing protein [Orpheovirus IHUMI-LCC2]SNW62865.1 Transmembrane domain-containing protein [Orpheovirus IHUMI-LCC2]